MERRGSTATSQLMQTYSPAPVTFARGEGCYLWDDEGRRYLDFLSGLGVTSLGHAHPAVAGAICEAAKKLLHTSNLFRTQPAEDLARALDRLLGGGGKVFFANSGAEANECAFKLARKWAGHGRYVVLSAYGSFHGRTLATLHATGQPEKHEAFQPLPEGFHHVAWQDPVALEKALTPEVAAVILEPVQGESGVWPAGRDYFAAARELCDKSGALFIVDEVQAGLGRTGKWWGFEHYGARPDVVTVAKALGNGVPIAACWARSEVAGAFAPGDHGSTFGGQPLAASAALATLAVMEEEDAPARAAARGNYLKQKLEGLAGVANVRGLGLMLAAELSSGDAPEVARRCLEEGLVVNAVTATALRLEPPLLISEEEIDEGVAALARVLEGGS
jgi:acetylornithine/N-succinyldiaminopimelate aminotransferase